MRSLPSVITKMALRVVLCLFIFCTAQSWAEDSDASSSSEESVTEEKTLLREVEYTMGYNEYIDEESCNCTQDTPETSFELVNVHKSKNYEKSAGTSAHGVSIAIITRRPTVSDLRIEYWPNQSKVSVRINDAVDHFSKKVEYHQQFVIFCHGFLDEPSRESFQTLRKAFKKRGYEPLALNSHALIGSKYLQSVTLVPEIGKKLGETLADLVKKGVNISGIHLIGHSLGAHISGFAGKTVHSLVGRKVGRISGLDPAGPCFKAVTPEDRLKKEDADFVDVIHTDIGQYGLEDKVGHVDFYPNGGTKQPGCTNLPVSCNHLRVWRYYAESIRKPKAFMALRCNDWTSFKLGKCGNDTSYMGYYTTKDTQGVFCLRTHHSKPFGMGLRGLKYA